MERTSMKPYAARPVAETERGWEGYRWLRRWRGVRSHLVAPTGVAVCGATPFPGKDWYDDQFPACEKCERRRLKVTARRNGF